MRVNLPPYSIRLELAAPPPTARALKRAARAALLGLPKAALRRRLRPGVSYTLSLSAVSSPRIQALNRAWRKKDRPTDVLSFSRLEGPALPFAVGEIGDLVVSPPVVRKQAKELGIPFEEELMRVTVHGVLHLFGYDHETNEEDARRMFRLQDRILARLGITPESPRSDRASRPSPRGKAWRYI